MSESPKNPNECTEKYWELMSAYADGEASEAEATELLAHLDTCMACAREFAMLEHSLRELAAVEAVEAPSGLRSTILAATTQRPTFGDRVRLALASRPLGFAAAATAIALAYLALRPSELPPMSPTDTGASTMAELESRDLLVAPEQTVAGPGVPSAPAPSAVQLRAARRSVVHEEAARRSLVAVPKAVASTARPGHIGSPRMLAALPFDPTDQPARFKAVELEASPLSEAEVVVSVDDSGAVINLAKAKDVPVVASKTAETAAPRAESTLLTEENKSRIRISLAEGDGLKKFDQPSYRASSDGLTLLRGRF